jgi:hypothetical protein
MDIDSSYETVKSLIFSSVRRAGGFDLPFDWDHLSEDHEYLSKFLPFVRERYSLLEELFSETEKALLDSASLTLTSVHPYKKNRDLLIYHTFDVLFLNLEDLLCHPSGLWVVSDMIIRKRLELGI